MAKGDWIDEPLKFRHQNMTSAELCLNHKWDEKELKLKRKENGSVMIMSLIIITQIHGPNPCVLKQGCLRAGKSCSLN